MMGPGRAPTAVNRSKVFGEGSWVRARVSYGGGGGRWPWDPPPSIYDAISLRDAHRYLMGWATQRGPRHRLVATSHRLCDREWVQSSAGLEYVSP